MTGCRKKMTDKAWHNLTEQQWEAICNHCGRCCLLTLEDEETGKLYHTDIACRYYDEKNCRCSVYEKRFELQPECLKITKDNVDKLPWMPKMCAYRKLFDRNYRPQKFTKLTGKIISQTQVKKSDWEKHIVEENNL